jgi:hypothetical protein
MRVGMGPWRCSVLALTPQYSAASMRLSPRFAMFGGSVPIVIRSHFPSRFKCAD